MRRTIAVLFVLALIGAGCGGGTTGDRVARMVPNPSNTIELESRDGGLPAQFPRNFPLPRDHKVLYASVSPFGQVVYFSTPLSSSEIKSFLVSELRKKGWRLNVCHVTPASSGSFTTLVFSTTRFVASIQVGYSPEAATRLKDERFSFFVSLAGGTERPSSTADAC